MAKLEGFSVNDFEHLENAQDTAYGIYDTQDNCWLGDETGPKLFTREHELVKLGMPRQLAARIAAQMTAVQLGYTPGRLQAVEFKGQDLVHKDSVDTKMTALAALKILETDGRP